jgi:prophage maintenance system killer protein
VIEGVSQQSDDVIIYEGVVDVFTLAALREQSCLMQHLEPL